MSAARALAEYAAGLSFDALPAAAVAKARHCLVDAVGCAIFGARFPWSRMIVAEARATGAGGPCRLPGDADGEGLHPPQAALAMGALAHAYELDSLRKPGSGVHPGATVALPALAVAEAENADGRALLTAIAAGCEVMFRIGNATLHSAEARGFHAPGITGPFGAAVAAGLLMGLDAGRLAMAMGIAGSLAGGLLAFARSGDGGMVKRLHLGRAAEAGVLAARLAARGYEGPSAVLEGRFGLLDAFCPKADAARLTAGLGSVWEIERLCIKRYPCHVTAHAPVQLLRGWMAAEGFGGADIAGLTLAAPAKVLSHHGERAPGDAMLAQYSVPFTLALAAFRDPEDAATFYEGALDDPRVADLAGRIRLVERTAPGASSWGAEMEVRLASGRVLAGAADGFLGCPETPFDDAGLAGKFRRIAGPAHGALLGRLMALGR